MNRLVYQQKVSFQVNPQDLPLLSFEAEPLMVGLRCFGLSFVKGMIARDAFAEHLNGWTLDRDILQPDGLVLHQPGGSAVVLRGTLTPEDPHVVLDVIPYYDQTVVVQTTQSHPAIVGTTSADPHISMALLPDTGRLYRFKGTAYVYDSLDLWAADILSPSDPLTYHGIRLDDYPIVTGNAIGKLSGRAALRYDPLTLTTVIKVNGRLASAWGSASLPPTQWDTGSAQDFTLNYDAFPAWVEGQPISIVGEVTQDSIPAQIQATFPESAAITAEWPDGALEALQAIAPALEPAGPKWVGWLRGLTYLADAPVRQAAGYLLAPVAPRQDYPSDVPFLTEEDAALASLAGRVGPITDPSVYLPFLLVRGAASFIDIAALFSGFGWAPGILYSLVIGRDEGAQVTYVNLYISVEGEQQPRVYHKDVSTLAPLPGNSVRIAVSWLKGEYTPGA